mgnify:CR=1 FL=1
MVIDELLAAGPVVVDGAWGTMFQGKGLSGGACPDGWNLTHPDRVEEVACAYVAAGSQGKKTFYPCTGMFRTLTFKSMWQKQHQSIHDPPFFFST